MIKFTILLARNTSLTHQEFVHHHRNVHAALFMSVRCSPADGPPLRAAAHPAGDAFGHAAG